ncbi:MAG: ABC transporter ATP-binding protein [Bdellovibrionales bacterium]|nr:ABC transporter ATP-binding protein [Ramlibacter sp.]
MTEALRIEDLRLAYPQPGGEHVVVDGLSLALDAGAIGCLLGPSGCGKSTVLRAIAGLEPARAGRISLGGQLLSGPGVHVAPELRRVGMVFQEYALFPHLTAAGNIGYGLRRLPAAEREARVKSMLALVGLPEAQGRYPHELSGGQQQRISLARSLAPSPTLLLLDEPFSNLDAVTRRRLRGEVSAILRDAGQTAILVTHHESDARAMADRIGTLEHGVLRGW